MAKNSQKKWHLGIWEMLFKVLDEGSISRASRQLNLERSQISRMLSALESEINCRLIEHSGKKIRPTQAALVARNGIEPLIHQLQNTFSEIHLDRNAQSGNIRFGAMPGFLQTQVVPLIAEFQQQNPSISFDVIGDDNPKGFMQGQSDIMLYYGPVDNPNLIEHWVTHSAFIPCASPSYLAICGTPHRPEDLSEHAGVIYTGNVRPHSAILKRFDKESGFKFKSQIRFNNILLAKEAAKQGCGIVLDMPLHHCIDEIMSGDLVPVLDGWHIPNLDNYIASTREAGKLHRVQKFIDWYIDKRREIEGEQKRRIQEKFLYISFD